LLIKEWEDELKEVLLAKKCSFSATQKTFETQFWFRCKTCNLVQDNNCGTCLACAQVCHVGHEIEYDGFSRAYCDCPGEEGRCKCLAKPDELLKCDEFQYKFKEATLEGKCIKTGVQFMYTCSTCDVDTCHACSMSCHEGHNVEFKKFTNQECSCASRECKFVVKDPPVTPLNLVTPRK